MKIHHILLSSCLALAAGFSACDDETSRIGSSLSRGEVIITIDSLTFDLEARRVDADCYDSRSTSYMIGRLSAPEYGELACSFVTRLMCADALSVPDSISSNRVDSVAMFVTIPRGYITGDSLAPQVLNIYKLEKELPSDITNAFNPEGYYSAASLMGTKSFTASAIAMGDSAFLKLKNLTVTVPVDRKVGVDLFNTYRSNPDIFSWPQTFSKYFPGLFVESGFGRGCISNITSMKLVTYFHYLANKTTVTDSTSVTKQVHVKDSVALLATAPEVLSSNNITYRVASSITRMWDEGKTVITTPGGYQARITLPARKIIESYKKNEANMSVISNLTLSIPATGIDNDFGIGIAPNILMVKTSELENFFKGNRIPDNENSFWAAYSSNTGRYYFSSLRNFILPLIDKAEITEEDTDFTLVPVEVITEDVKNNYTGEVTTYVTDCRIYTLKPTMTLLSTDKAQLSFTYSAQQIR